MSELIRVPDIGGGEGEVIELLVKVGDRIEADQSLLTLESDKASMEIPAPKAGVIKSLKVKLGDRLKTGDELLELESEDALPPQRQHPWRPHRRQQPSQSRLPPYRPPVCGQRHRKRAGHSGAGHRHLQQGQGHRSAGQAGRRDCRRPAADHPGVGQGQHGNPRAARRHRGGRAGAAGCRSRHRRPDYPPAGGRQRAGPADPHHTRQCRTGRGR